MTEKVSYLHLHPNEEVPQFETSSPYLAVIIAEAKVAQEWRHKVNRQLVESGCKYTVSWGVDCAIWDDDIDWADMERYSDFIGPDDEAVMTTWFDDEGLIEAFWFAATCAEHDKYELSRTVLVHIAERERQQKLLATYEASKTLI